MTRASDREDEALQLADDTTEATHLHWRDPLLLELAESSDLEVLMMHEERLFAAKGRRDKCLSELRSHLHGQVSNRDRIRAHGGAGRDALRAMLVYGARTTLATLLGELRMASAELMIALHHWRLELTEARAQRP